jgi:hypothetical protein
MSTESQMGQVRADDHGRTTELQRAQWEAQRHSNPMADCPVCIYICIGLLAVTVAAAAIEGFSAMGWL